MPIPVGTNASHLRTVSRWTLLGVLLVAPVSLWWPTRAGWAALLAGTLAVWVLWLCWRTTAEKTDVPGHAMHLALLVAVGITVYHLIGHALAPSPARPNPLKGQMDMSLVTQLALLALLVMLTQDLLPTIESAGAAPALFGASMVAGALAGLLAAGAGGGRVMLALMGWAGLALWCWPFWPIDRGGPPGEWLPPPQRRWIGRHAGLLLALAAAVVLTGLCPAALPVVTGAATGTLLLATVFLAGRRSHLAQAAVAVGALAAAEVWAVGWIARPDWPNDLTDWIGRGEMALVADSPAAGWPMLHHLIGWGGVLWLCVCLLGCLARALAAAGRAERGRQERALLATFAAVLITAALLTPGGLFCPAVNAAFILTWAAIGQLTGREARRRSGGWVLAAALLFGLLLGVVPKGGLLTWTAAVYRPGDIVLHGLSGWMITQVMLWLFGRTRRGALLAVAMSMAGAAAGEIAQGLFTRRQAQWRDIGVHAVGAAIAMVIYAVCRLSLRAESPDATPRPKTYRR